MNALQERTITMSLYQFLKVLQEDKAHFQKVYQEIIHER